MSTLYFGKVLSKEKAFFNDDSGQRRDLQALLAKKLDALFARDLPFEAFREAFTEIARRQGEVWVLEKLGYRFQAAVLQQLMADPALPSRDEIEAYAYDFWMINNLLHPAFPEKYPLVAMNRFQIEFIQVYDNKNPHYLQHEYMGSGFCALMFEEIIWDQRKEKGPISQFFEDRKTSISKDWEETKRMVLADKVYDIRPIRYADPAFWKAHGDAWWHRYKDRFGTKHLKGKAKSMGVSVEEAFDVEMEMPWYHLFKLDIIAHPFYTDLVNVDVVFDCTAYVKYTPMGILAMANLYRDC